MAESKKTNFLNSIIKPSVSKTNSRRSKSITQSQLIFDFFFEDENESSDCSSWDSSSNIVLDGVEVLDRVEEEEEEEEDDDENYASKAESAKVFWDSQDELLMATLCRTTSFESKIRKATKDALKDLKSDGDNVSCDCRRTVADGCRKCTQEQICRRLQVAGYSSYICKSKWKRSTKIPAGEHTYIEVVETSTSRKGEVKVIIELNFQAEFVVAKACKEYDRLAGRLPEIFVGKQERMKTLVKILCCALKKCLKEKKVHMAPWRKEKYMQAKWVGKKMENNQEIMVEKLLPFGNNNNNDDDNDNDNDNHHHFERIQRPKASMLTFDLLDNLQGMNLVHMIQVL